MSGCALSFTSLSSESLSTHASEEHLVNDRTTSRNVKFDNNQKMQNATDAPFSSLPFFSHDLTTAQFSPWKVVVYWESADTPFIMGKRQR